MAKLPLPVSRPDRTRVIPASVLRVLVAVLKAADAGRKPTVRELAGELGRNHTFIHQACHKLREAGLVDCGDYRRGVVPTCRMALWT